MITETQKEWAEDLFRSYSSEDIKDMLGDALLASCMNSLVYLKAYNIPPSDEDIDPLQNLKMIYDCFVELVNNEEKDRQRARIAEMNRR